MYKIILLLKYYYKWQHLVQFVKKVFLYVLCLTLNIYKTSKNQ